MACPNLPRNTLAPSTLSMYGKARGVKAIMASATLSVALWRPRTKGPFVYISGEWSSTTTF